MPNDLPKVEAFLSGLKEQTFFDDEGVQGSVLWYIAFYRTRAPLRRKAFRVTGFILLLLSISLPFLMQISPVDWQIPIAAGMAWLIALVGAANSFFNWQKVWQIYIQTQLTLQFALSEWELRTAEARAAATDEEGVKLLQASLQRLTKSVSEAVANETAQYFEGVNVLDVQPSKNS
jgi:urea transporter